MSAKIFRMKDSEPESLGAFAQPLLAKQEDLSDIENRPLENSAPGDEKENLTTVALLEGEKTMPELVCLNLSGKKFFVLLKNFAKLPNTRLAKMVRCTEKAEIETYCNRFNPGPIPEYYFDRNWKGFNDILDVYRIGSLHINSSGGCGMSMKAQLEFWGIDELLLDPCCALKYYPEVEQCEKEIWSQRSAERKYLERIKEEDFGSTKICKLRKMLWNLTEYPETSFAAQVFAFTSIAIVVISTVTFVLSTIPELTDNIDFILFENGTDSDANSSKPTVERWEEGILALRIVDELTMWFFTLEYVMRFTCSPQKWKFFKAPLNVVDLLAILPYFVGFIVESVKDTQVIGRAGKVLRLIRVMRILRVFKLVRHFSGLQSLLSTLKQAYKELGLLMVLVWVTVLTVSSLVYFAEKDSAEKWSFFDSFWWGLMVLTTVGYGSTAPSTAIGKIIGGFCALLGVFILALPVPIVVNRFNDFASNHKNGIWKNEVMLLKQDRKEDENCPLKQPEESDESRCNGLKEKV